MEKTAEEEKKDEDKEDTGVPEEKKDETVVPAEEAKPRAESIMESEGTAVANFEAKAALTAAVVDLEAEVIAEVAIDGKDYQTNRPEEEVKEVFTAEEPVAGEEPVAAEVKYDDEVKAAVEED